MMALSGYREGWPCPQAGQAESQRLDSLPKMPVLSHVCAPR